MRIEELKPNHGANKGKRRVGRGPGSGLGKTCGRGGKGQTARGGSSIRPGFEGGQTPLYRRLPKRGFTNVCSIDVTTLNLRNILSYIKDGVFDSSFVTKKGFVKILSMGIVPESLKIVKNCKISFGARQKLVEKNIKIEE